MNYNNQLFRDTNNILNSYGVPEDHQASNEARPVGIEDEEPVRPQDDLPQASPAISPPASGDEEEPASIQDSASDPLEQSGPAAGIMSGSEQDEEFEGGESGEDEEQDQARQQHEEEAGFADGQALPETFGAQPAQDEMESPAQEDSDREVSEEPDQDEDQEMEEPQASAAHDEEGEDEEEGEYAPDEEAEQPDDSESHEEEAEAEQPEEEQASESERSHHASADVPMAHEEEPAPAEPVGDDVEMFLQPRGSQADHQESIEEIESSNEPQPFPAHHEVSMLFPAHSPSNQRYGRVAPPCGGTPHFEHKSRC